LNTVLIGVSEFFRDPAVFEYLAQSVLPELIKTRRRLRVCSAGVSGGQELYSVAMLLAESGVLEHSDLLGVDCRFDAIRRARAGIYGAVDLDNVTPERRQLFFRQKESRWEVSCSLKKRVRWDVQDLLALDAGGPCDLILFRNVAIYFNDRHGVEAWTRLYDQLAPGGFIITGKAEKPPVELSLIRMAPSVYQRRAS
jgi:chemotaxis methyl-accepting protein methylase